MQGRTNSDVITIALAGNPNSGKTTVFNCLTGSRQHVGNYPGVTVEKKQGYRLHKGYRINVVDLPGTYSLTAHSIEELIARSFVVEEKPDVVVDIIDATNLERNLYLAVQFLEMGTPLVLAMNMSDMAKARGYEIDYGRLSVLLGCEIVPTVATKGEGMSELLDAVVRAASGKSVRPPVSVNYGAEVEEEIGRLAGLLDECSDLSKDYGARWLALKLLENDQAVREKVQRECPKPDEVLAAAERSSRHIEGVLGDIPEIIIADRRYGFISGACRESVRTTVQSRYDTSERIDSILTNRIIGLPLFFGLMYIVFQLTFALGEPLTRLLEQFFSWVGGGISALWPTDSQSDLKSLLVDGIIGGVGSVLSFIPNIMLLFLAIAVLEDSGYMSRVAFIMDRIMHTAGLHGKSFIPMLIGFGCSVPGIMATRTLENRTDRLTTILVLPLISCGARLTIYALIIPAFFSPSSRAPVLWTIYLIGILLAMLGARLLRSTLLKGEATPFVMELPPYRMPTIRGVAIHMWERASMYVRKAATVILSVSVVLWALTTYPKSSSVEQRYAKKITELQPSYSSSGDKLTEQPLHQVLAELKREKRAEMLARSAAGRIGRFLEPALKPLGFDWRIGTAFLGAFAAKEVFVAQMGIVFSVGEVEKEPQKLRQRLRENYSPLTAFCVMLFSLIAAPCVATIAATRRETGLWRWAVFQFLGLTALAYVLTLGVYQIGRRFAR
jgi:ferrous iron transport protein B